MDLKAELEREHSKKLTVKIVRYVGKDAEKFAELMRIFFGGEYRLTQRAAWPVSYCAVKHPALFIPYLNECLDLLARGDVHNAVKRNITRILQDIEIPEKYAGKVYTICFDLVDNINESIAVRAFALTVATRIARAEPGLVPELKMMVENHLPHATAAFKVRARELMNGSVPGTK